MLYTFIYVQYTLFVCRYLTERCWYATHIYTIIHCTLYPRCTHSLITHTFTMQNISTMFISLGEHVKTFLFQCTWLFLLWLYLAQVSKVLQEACVCDAVLTCNSHLQKQKGHKSTRNKDYIFVGATFVCTETPELTEIQHTLSAIVIPIHRRSIMLVSTAAVHTMTLLALVIRLDTHTNTISSI